MAKASATTATTPATAAVEFDWSQFDAPEFKSDKPSRMSFATALLLNQKDVPFHGLFVSEESAIQAGWCGTGRWEKPNHINKFSDKKSPGYLFHGFVDDETKEDYREKYPAPRIQVLNVSPMFIQLTSDETPALEGDGPFVHPDTGEVCTKNDIVGIYQMGSSNPIYETLKLKGELAGKSYVTLRTVYLIYLLDENNQKLHDMPLALSIRGAAARSFGIAYEQWQTQFNQCFAKVSGTQLDFSRSQTFYAMGVFVPTLRVGSAGTKQTSNVTEVASFVRPTPENFFSLFLGQQKDDVVALVEATKDFANSYYAEMEEKGFGRILPGVETTSKLLGGVVDPDVDPITGEMILPPLRSAAIDEEIPY